MTGEQTKCLTNDWIIFEEVVEDEIHDDDDDDEVLSIMSESIEKGHNNEK